MAVSSEEREQSEREERKEMHYTVCRGGFNTKCDRKPLKSLKA